MTQRLLQFINIGILTTFAAIFMLVVSTVPASAALDLKQSVDCGSSIKLTPSSACEVKGEANSNRISDIIKTVINILSAIVGAVSIIMIILGGFKYITSNGDSNNISSAKNTILYALVGLIIVAFAQVLVQFVLERTA